MRADILVVLYVHDAVYCGGVVYESGHIGGTLIYDGFTLVAGTV